MEVKKHSELMNELKSSELTDVRKAEILIELSADYNAMQSSVDELTKKLEDSEKKVTEYALLNTKMFTQITATKSDLEKENDTDDTDTENKDVPKKMSYDDLTF